jgi:diguanylate cyclase
MSAQGLQTLLKQAQQALTMMHDGAIPPTPLNYDFLYRYLTGADPLLCEAVNKEREKGNTISAPLVEKIRRKLYGGAQIDDANEIVDTAQNQLSKVAEYLQSASEDAREYKQTLHAGGAALTNAKDTKHQSQTIADVMASTADMIERTQKLEARLAMSAQEIMVLKRDLEKARSESRTDGLTGLPNRKAFEAAIEMQAARSLVDKRSFCLAFCDIDHFKLFNDTWGHALGDEVLRLVAHSLERLSHGVGMAARYGGEEFVVLLPQRDLAASVDICEQICDYVSSRKVRSRTGNLDLGKVTLSIESLIERADAALYCAKQMGRNQVRTEIDLEARDKAKTGKSASAA